VFLVHSDRWESKKEKEKEEDDDLPTSGSELSVFFPVGNRISSFSSSTGSCVCIAQINTYGDLVFSILCRSLEVVLLIIQSTVVKQILIK